MVNPTKRGKLTKDTHIPKLIPFMLLSKFLTEYSRATNKIVYHILILMYLGLSWIK